ncbi:hypothetical protein ACGRH2_13390 [Vibrio barjaei]|uniref:DUF1523 domain-containing protein n=1 Tax=Vibrio barjaei TaxID=1676683 RepID=A0ABW7IIE8_9VIBR
MENRISLKGFTTFLLMAVVYLYFTAYNTIGEQVTAQSKVQFVREGTSRFGGIHFYFKLTDGTRLKAPVDKESAIKIRRNKEIINKFCDVVYFKNESLVFNEIQTLRSLNCEGVEIYKNLND